MRKVDIFNDNSEMEVDKFMHVQDLILGVALSRFFLFSYCGIRVLCPFSKCLYNNSAHVRHIVAHR